MEEQRRIRDREEIPQEDKWAIEDLYATDEAWEADLQALGDQKVHLSGFAGQLGNSAETLYNYLYALEQMAVKAERLAGYAMRRTDEDTRNAFYQAMSGKFMSVYVDVYHGYFR